MAKAKFYAVKAGRQKGIFLSWDDCKNSISGYSGAKYKSFPTRAEAEAFLNDTSPQSRNSSFSSENLPENYAFVDGSFNPETFEYGYGGFLVSHGEKYTLQGSDFGELSSMRNVAGEIEGAMAAILKAQELGLAQLTIFFDYQGIAAWADGAWSANKEGTKRYKNFVKEARKTMEISFIKVAAHSGIEGNEEADRLAKEAVGLLEDEDNDGVGNMRVSKEEFPDWESYDGFVHAMSSEN